MLLTRDTQLKIAAAAAAAVPIVGDATHLPIVGLVTEDITPNENCVVDDLIPLQNAASEEMLIEVAAHSAARYQDPVDGCIVIHFTDPSGGFVFTFDNLVTYPQIVRGFFLANSARDLLGVKMFDEPIEITNNDQSLDIGDVTIKFLPGMAKA